MKDDEKKEEKQGEAVPAPDAEVEAILNEKNEQVERVIKYLKDK